MRKRAIALAVALLVLASEAGATTLPDCCACVPDHKATAAGFDRLQTVAVFCAEAERGNTSELEARCDLQPGQALVCFPNIPGPSCAAQLAEEGIVCPAAGAPAAGPLTLIALAAALSLFGAATLHRRRRATQKMRPRT